MILRNHSARIPILTVVALAVATSLFGLWYAYASYGLPAISSPSSPSAEQGTDSSKQIDWDSGKHEYDVDAPKGDNRSYVAKVSVAANKLDNDMIHRAFMTHETQNELHGYHQFIATEEAVSDLIENDAKHRPKGAWTKPAYMLSIIVAELEKPEEDRLKWLFWFDADTVVTNPKTPLEVFLPPDDEEELNSIHLLMASNWDGLNSGAFAVRVHPWTASMLSAVLAYPIYKAEKMEKDRFRDQSAFQWLLEDEGSPLTQTPTKGREHWAVPPMRWFNSLPVNNAFDKKNGIGWLFGHAMEGKLFDNGTDDVFDDGHGGKIQPWKVMQGDMIVHFAGSTAGGTRDSWMGPWLDRCEAELPEWSNPETQHVLRDDVVAFWKRTVQRLKRERDEAKRAEVPLPDDQKQ